MPSTRIRLWIAVVATLGLALVGCGGGGGQSADKAAQAKGPIKIWYSNNADEVKWGKAVVAAWNQAHADRAGDRRGDPGRQELRGGHRGLDHGREHPLPDLQHRAGRGAAVPEAGRAGGAGFLQRRGVLHPGADRAAGRPVQVTRRQVLPDAVEDQPGDDLLQQGRLRQGRAGHQEPAAEDLRRVPGHLQDAGRQGRGQGGHLAGAVQRVLPVLVRLLPAVHRRDRQAAGRGRPAAVQHAGGCRSRRVLEADVQRRPGPAGAVQRRLVRRQEGGHGDRGAVGDRGVRRQGQVGGRADPDQ